MGAKVDTVDARRRLKPRAEPYWTRVSAGCQIGFRKMTSTSTGTWIAKFRDADDDRREKRSLGDFDHLPPSQRHDAAKAAAEEWFKHLRKGRHRRQGHGACGMRSVRRASAQPRQGQNGRRREEAVCAVRQRQAAWAG